MNAPAPLPAQATPNVSAPHAGSSSHATAAAEIVRPLAFTELPQPQANEPSLLAQTVTNPLLNVKARIQVCVGEVMIRVGDLLEARADQVIALNQALDAPVDLLLDGQVIARGELIAVDQSFGVRITELPRSLSL